MVVKFSAEIISYYVTISLSFNLLCFFILFHRTVVGFAVVLLWFTPSCLAGKMQLKIQDT